MILSRKAAREVMDAENVQFPNRIALLSFVNFLLESVVKIWIVQNNLLSISNVLLLRDFYLFLFFRKILSLNIIELKNKKQVCAGFEHMNNSP